MWPLLAVSFATCRGRLVSFMSQAVISFLENCVQFAGKPSCKENLCMYLFPFPPPYNCFFPFFWGTGEWGRTCKYLWSHCLAELGNSQKTAKHEGLGCMACAHSPTHNFLRAPSFLFCIFVTHRSESQCKS